MSVIFTLILIAIICFNLGFWGKRLAQKAPVWLMPVIGAGVGWFLAELINAIYR